MSNATRIMRGTVVTVDSGTIVLDSVGVELFRHLAAAVKADTMPRRVAVWGIRQCYPQLQLRGAVDVLAWFLDGERA